MKLENIKKGIIKNVKDGKNENYLNISTPRLLAVSSELTNTDYPKILDEINNLVFKRIQV